MFEEAIQGDKGAVAEYNEVLADTHLPSEAAAIIRRQRDRINQNLEKIRIIEDVR